MKHLMSFSELNESIGRGSVLLIKGREREDGRPLYVTTVDGWAEIKPGLNMVFISDKVYRVIYREGKGFSGVPVSYYDEAGLKGIFNMRNQGKPSIVLNHNKTPFHWVTLKYQDIGSALRAIGPNLFAHDLIFESQQIPKKINTHSEAENFIIREFISILSGGSSDIASIKKFEFEGIEGFESDLGQSGETTNEFEWSMSIDLEFKLTDITVETYNTLLKLGIIYDIDPAIKENPEILEITGLNPYTTLKIDLISQVSWNSTWDDGGYDRAPEGESQINSCETDFMNIVYLNGMQVELEEETESVMDQFIKDSSEYTAWDFEKDFNVIINSEKSEDQRWRSQMIRLAYDLRRDLDLIVKSKITEEEREEFEQYRKKSRKFYDHEILHLKSNIRRLEYLYELAMIAPDGSISQGKAQQTRQKLMDKLSKDLELDAMGIV